MINYNLKQPNIALFCYNFPHKKTQDFLLRLFLEGFKIKLAIAADPVKLDIPPSTIRTKVKHTAVIHPRIIANKIGIKYYVLPHNSRKTAQLLRQENIDIGIIAGARILKKNIINSVKLGIINFHPGLIPEVRGLDALLWAIYKGIPLGVTAHLIDEHIDAGRILLKKKINVEVDDTIFDLSERLYETQLTMLKPAISLALSGKWKEISIDSKNYNKKMPSDIEKLTIKKLPEYIMDYQKGKIKIGTDEQLLKNQEDLKK